MPRSTSPEPAVGIAGGRRIEALLARRGAAPAHAQMAPRRPRTGVAVVSCMDARLDVYRILALTEGDAHVIRNAGGTITEDVILGLAVSQRLLGTREILVLHHVDCAMRHLSDDDLAAAVQRDSGERPPWRFQTCSDPRLRVLDAVQRLTSDRRLIHTQSVRGVVYDEQSDTLAEVQAP
jgi:carbonic anhydrase